MHWLRCHAEAAMRLTSRCRDLLQLVRAARWLTTNQIHTRFFRHATIDATRKRLRKLTEAKYLAMVQPDRMSQALFTLGREGKRTLETANGDTILLDRKPPIQLEHFLAMNDLRIAAELAGGLNFFFAYWELPGLGWREALIPDAVFALNEFTFAVEFDRGLEGVRFFANSKWPLYPRGFSELTLSAVLVVTDRESRMASLAAAIGDSRVRVLFSTLDKIRLNGMLAPVFYPTPGSEAVALV
jgi:hypothetical protein